MNRTSRRRFGCSAAWSRYWRSTHHRCSHPRRSRGRCRSALGAIHARPPAARQGGESARYGVRACGAESVRNAPRARRHQPRTSAPHRGNRVPRTRGARVRGQPGARRGSQESQGRGRQPQGCTRRAVEEGEDLERADFRSRETLRSKGPAPGRETSGRTRKRKKLRARGTELATREGAGREPAGVPGRSRRGGRAGGFRPHRDSARQDGSGRGADRAETGGQTRRAASSGRSTRWKRSPSASAPPAPTSPTRGGRRACSCSLGRPALAKPKPRWRSPICSTAAIGTWSW